MNNLDDTAMPIDDATKEHRRDEESLVFRDYAAIIRRLRAPDGCPWDRKQTLQSLRNHIVEEAFELVAAITELSASADDRTTSYDHVSEELGDVFLVAMLLSDSLQREGSVSFRDVLLENGNKLIRRHPHVFSDESVHDADEVVLRWQDIKKHVEGKKSGPSAVSAGLPPLERSYEIQKKAAKDGFDWPDVSPAINKIREELDEIEEELREMSSSSPSSNTEKEIGDLLFSVVNVARKLKLDPSVALDRSNREFLRRYSHIETRVAESGKTMNTMTLMELDELWEEAKRSQT